MFIFVYHSNNENGQRDLKPFSTDGETEAQRKCHVSADAHANARAGSTRTSPAYTRRLFPRLSLLEELRALLLESAGSS